MLAAMFIAAKELALASDAFASGQMNTTMRAAHHFFK